jgi:aminoglycoside phosphotransferase (APT) family kinase protein
VTPVVADRPEGTLATLDASVASEVRRVLSQMAGRHVTGLSLEVRELRRGARVCRVRVADGRAAWSVIVKRLPLSRAHRSTLATQRWLPAIGLRHSAPALLGAVAPPGAAWVWHLYEDTGAVTLHDRRSERRAVDAAVGLIAGLHVRAARHPLVPECRAEGQDYGFYDFLTGVEDARRLLDMLQDAGSGRTSERARVKDALRAHLDALLADAPRRGALFRDAAGPETMLHGDLWTTNVAVSDGRGGSPVRLIDWDRAGAGPLTYDLSTFLLRFPPAERRSVLASYRDALERGGWRLPPEAELNVLCDTAECARYADRIVECAIAILQDGAEWAHDVLAEVLRWFEALAPVIPEQ